MNKSNTVNNALELAFKKAVEEKNVTKKETIKSKMFNLNKPVIQPVHKAGSIPVEKIKRVVKSVSKHNES